jgi:hypothetical protein
MLPVARNSSNSSRGSVALVEAQTRTVAQQQVERLQTGSATQRRGWAETRGTILAAAFRRWVGRSTAPFLLGLVSHPPQHSHQLATEPGVEAPDRWRAKSGGCWPRRGCVAFARLHDHGRVLVSVRPDFARL